MMLLFAKKQTLRRAPLYQHMMLKSSTSQRIRTTVNLKNRWRRSITTAQAHGHTEEDIDKARQWFAAFSGLPSNIYDISYSRSSGPGGQNVNKSARTFSQSVLHPPQRLTLELG